jgi:hypothetical protein
MKTNKKKKIIITAIIIFILLLAAIPVIFALTTSYTVLINSIGGKYYRARVLLLAGDSLFCLKDSREYDKRKPAIESGEPDFNFSVVPMAEVVYMEVIPDFNVTVYSQEDGDIPIKYLGKFKVDVAGNIGYLYLKKKDGKLYGTIRFPDWAKGVYEPLKSLWISKGKIGFIRSVDTPKEARYVGVTAYFIQEYYGDYVRKGNMIEGNYTSRGVKNQWRAYRVK